MLLLKNWTRNYFWRNPQYIWCAQIIMITTYESYVESSCQPEEIIILARMIFTVVSFFFHIYISNLSSQFLYTVLGFKYRIVTYIFYTYRLPLHSGLVHICIQGYVIISNIFCYLFIPLCPLMSLANMKWGKKIASISIIPFSLVSLSPQ